MQSYYNYIPMYKGGGAAGFVGGLIETIAKKAGRAKIQGNANLLSKLAPDLSKMLSKLAKSLNGGPKLTEEESKELVTLALNYRRSNIHYLNRRNKINELLSAKRLPKHEPVLSQLPLQLLLQLTNPIPGTTLSSRWKQMKTWINEHPKTAIGVPLVALGTGPGRYVTGNVLSFTQSNPENWFNDLPQTVEGADNFIMINGTKIPIKKSSEGYFVPAMKLELQTDPTLDFGEVDLALDGITNLDLDQAMNQQLATSQQGGYSIPDQQTINDLFAEDQWL